MDLQSESFVEKRIPHRSPFLWIDKVLDLTADSIQAEKYISKNLELFTGHYPGHPLMPGVLLCEAVFQAGALLIAEKFRQETGRDEMAQSVPVLTRIQNAKFKRQVHPGDTILVTAKLKERLGSAWFLKGSVHLAKKVVIQVDFACMLSKID